MGFIYREINKKSFISTGKNLATLAFIVVIVLYFIVFFSPRQNYSVIIRLIPIIPLVLSTYWIINNCIVKYNYLLIDNELVIRRVIGEKSSIILTINLKDIQQINLKSKQTFVCKKLVKMYAEGGQEQVYVVKAIKEGKTITFAFSPSQKLVEKMDKLLMPCCIQDTKN